MLYFHPFISLESVITTSIRQLTPWLSLVTSISSHLMVIKKGDDLISFLLNKSWYEVVCVVIQLIVCWRDGRLKASISYNMK